jgi:hypothetical protein
MKNLLITLIVKLNRIAPFKETIEGQSKTSLDEIMMTKITDISDIIKVKDNLARIKIDDLSTWFNEIVKVYENDAEKYQKHASKCTRLEIMSGMVMFTSFILIACAPLSVFVFALVPLSLSYVALPVFNRLRLDYLALKSKSENNAKSFYQDNTIYFKSFHSKDAAKDEQVLETVSDENKTASLDLQDKPLGK